jgi:methionine aminopeptidase
MSKGISFPTCVSVNNQFGNFSPSADSKAVLKEGDVCKM